MIRKLIRKHLFGLFLGLVLPSIAALGAQDVSARIGEAIVRQTNIRALLLVAVVGFLGYAAMKAFWGAGKKLLNDTSTTLECEIKKEVYNKTLRIEYNKLIEKKPEELYMNFNKDIDSVLSMFTDDLYKIVSSLIMGVGVFVLIFLRSVPVAIAVLVIVTGVVIVNACYVERFTDVARRERGLREEGTGILTQILAARSIIRVLKLQDVISREYGQNAERYFSIKQERNRLEVKKALSMDWLVYSCATMILPVSCLLVSMARMELPDVIYIIQLTGNIIWSTSSLGTAWLNFSRKKIALNALEQLLASLEDLEDERDSIQPAGEIALAFEDVTIWYGDTVPVKNLSFYCERGNITAVVGRSGIGKSSIINVILGFANYSGTVRVWNEVVTRQNIRAVRRSIAYMSEFCEMDDTSVEEAVCFGQETVDVNVVKEKVREFGLAEVNNSATASGGQKQRIAFLRAYMKECGIYILDEPTAAMDEKNEERIIRYIKELKEQGKTVLIVTHRERTMAVADKVIQLS